MILKTLVFCFAIICQLNNINANREKRFLIFPRAGPTRHQVTILKSKEYIPKI